METILEVSNLTKIKNKRKLVDNISFQVNSGEVFGLVGPNGSGKTSSIQMMLGLCHITEGEVFVCGYSVKHHFEMAMKNTGGMTDNFKFYKNMSGMQNLRHLAEIRCQDGKLPDNIDALIEMVGLQKRIHDKVKHYSLGMCQRLGLVQAMLHKPCLLYTSQRHTDAVKTGAWSQCKDFCFWNYPLVELEGKTLGIVGYGTIGKAVEKIALAFGMLSLIHI